MKATYCTNNGRDGGCPKNTAATRILLIRAQGKTVDLCENCTKALNARYDGLSPADKAKAVHPFFSSTEKVAAMEPILIALSRGESSTLIARQGKCSCANCEKPVGKMAFHNQGVVYPLCGSDSAAAQIAAVRYQRLPESPMFLDAAKNMATKWSEHDAIRRRRNEEVQKTMKTTENRNALFDNLLFTGPTAPANNGAPETVTPTVPKPRTAADLPIKSDLLTAKTGRENRRPVRTGVGTGLSSFRRPPKDDNPETKKETTPATTSN